MKKLATISVLAVSLLLVAGLAAILLWRKSTAITARPAELLPANALFLAEIVDLHQSAARWPSLELNKLFQEPEVKAFLEKPMARWDSDPDHKAYEADLIKVLPRQAFLAVQSLEGSSVKAVGGFSFAGDRAAAERLLKEPRTQMKAAHPAGRAEVSTHGKVEIQSYTDGSFVFAEAFSKNWYLAASDVGLLGSTLDRLDHANPTGAPAPDTLAADETYRQSVAPLPADSELRLYGRVSVLVDRLATAMMGVEGMDAGTLKALQQIRAMAASTKMEGGQWRDSIFTLKTPDPAVPAAAATALPREALALTTPETGVYFSTLMEAKGLEGMPPALLDKLPLLTVLEGALKEQNATLKDLGAIFGNELSMVVQNGKGGKFDGTLAVPMRDAQRARQLADALISPNRGTQAWTVDKTGGSPIYTPSDSAVPVVAMTDRFCLLSWSGSAVTSFIQRPADSPQLDTTPAFKAAAASVSAPNVTFGYVDLGALFESGYVWARPLLALTLAGNSDTSSYIDAGKLPSGGVIGRHLGTIVISQSARPDGELWESRGNLSTAQLVLGGGGALVNFAMNSPMLKQLAPSFPSMIGFPGAGGPQNPPATLSTDPTVTPDEPPSPVPPAAGQPPTPQPPALDR